MISSTRRFLVFLFVHVCHCTVVLDEDVAVGTFVLDVSSDIPKASSFALYKEGTLIAFQAGHFAVNESGVIRTNASLDYENVRLRSIRLFVIGSDGVSNFGRNVSIVIRDVDDNAPYFTDSVFYGFVRENVEVGSNVSGIPLLRAYDRDSLNNSVVRYELVNSTGLFSIWTIPQPNHSPFLSLQTLSGIDRDVTESVDVVVKAVDSGGLSSTATIRVFIEDENDNAPQFMASMGSSFQVLENARIGQSVFQARATDIDYDVNARVYFSLSPPLNEFSCHPQTGIVSVARALDFETTKQYSLTVRATDRGMPARLSEKNVTVNIVDVNEHAPTFVLPTAPVMVVNNAPLGFTVAQVEIMDDDAVIDEVITLEIIDGDPQTHFRVGPSQKASNRRVFPIFLKRVLNEDPDILPRFFLTLVAHDSGHPQLSSTSRLTIVAIQGTDDLRFEKNVYEVDIREDSPPGRLVKLISAGSSPTDSTTYSIIGIVTKFRIGRGTGMITVREPLDRETNDFYNVTVTARRSSQSVQANVFIRILDANDNSPSFTKPLYSISLPEDAAIGQLVSAVTAVDNDIGNNGDVRYSIVSSSSPNSLTVNEFNGAIAPALSLDYETAVGHSVGITIRAEDQGGPLHRSSHTHLLVSISDVNDNPPLFLQRSYSCAIPERGMVGIVCVQLNVFDVDSVNQMTFSIISGDSMNDFAVDSSGTVRTTRALDRESIPSYTLTIGVNDGRNEGENNATLVVTVLDIVDSAIHFSSTVYNVTVEDNLAVDSVIMKVHADTNDIGVNAMITYSLHGFSFFHIDPFSGDVRLTSPGLDASLMTVNKGTVTATGSGSSPKSATASVIINVVAGNNPPYFEVGTIDRRVVSSTVPVGSIVASIQAVDSDTNDTITYSLATPSPTFSLSGTDIYTTDFLHNGTEYSFSINAVDSGIPQKRANLVVYVTASAPGRSTNSQNTHSPVFQQSHYESHILEGTFPSTVVLTVSATDTDSPSLTYSISNVIPLSGSNLFGISGKGVIDTQDDIDREVAPVYFLTIQASDGQLSSQCSVTVIVDDQNDNVPQLAQRYDVIVQEHVPVGTRIFSLNDTDPDIGTGVRAMFLSQGVTKFFNVDPQYGYITTMKTLDLEASNDRPPPYITLRAEDKDTVEMFTTTRVYFHYVDVNDNPPVFDPTSYTASIPEDFMPGQSIVSLSASDADWDKSRGGKISFYIISGNKDGAFYIDEDTGVISSELSLDFEKVNHYSLVVEARDHGVVPQKSLSAARVDVHITNVNDFAPVFHFASYSVDIQTTVRKGDVIITLTATDDDLGKESEVRYELNSKHLSINSTTGEVVVSSSLPPGQTIVTVKATDQGTDIHKRNSTQTLLILNVVASNAAPVLPSTTQIQSLDENLEPGTMVTSVKSLVTDKDSGYSGVVLFAITRGNEDFRFDIDFVSGDIILLNRLNREKKAKYNLVITASDLGDPIKSSTVQYIINVLDINDNAPQFSLGTPFVLNVSETAAIGAFVGQVSASDDDMGTNGNVHYRIANDVLGHLNITEDMGHIKVSRTLDRESDATYQLLVEAYDLGTPNSLASSINVEVVVTDIADSRPVCNPSYYDVIIPGDYEVGFPVLQIQCMEVDNSMATYSLLSGNTSYWNVDSNSGIISLKATLAGNTEHHSLSVAAMNSLAPNLTAIVLVNVSVQRVEKNLHWPIFTSFEPSSGLLYENSSIGSSVLQLVAVDGDTGIEGEVEYFVAGGNGLGRFTMNESSGLLTLTSQIDHEISSEYLITVMARDKGSYPKSSQLTLKIFVAGVNNRPPIFSSGSSTVSLTETSSPGVFVAVTAAYDPDRWTGVRHSIISGNDELNFQIETVGGMITTGPTGVDRERNFLRVHSITVQATDVDQSMASTLLFVRLLDMDDNSPQFTVNGYNITVYSRISPDWPLVQVVAIDNDFGPNSAITYFATSANFTINQTTGVIVAKTKLVAVTQHRFNVQAVSGVTSRLDDIAPVMINVIGVSRSKRATNIRPSFNVSSITVREDHMVGRTVMAGPVAVDNDDDILMFRVEGSSGSSVVAIYPNSGVLYLSSSLDRELQDSYSFNVTVFDGIETVSAVVMMTVADVNDNWPVFKGPFVKTIVENMYPMSVIIEASDADTGNNSKLHYWIEEHVTPYSAGLFVWPDSNMLNVSKSLDREMASQHILIICAKDHGIPQKKNCTEMIINVQDVNDNAPLFPTHEYAAVIREDVLPGHHVLTVTVADLDVGDNAAVRYQLSSAESIPFVINETTGDLVISQSLDYELQQSYMFTIIAMDQGSPSLCASATAVIHIQDVHDSGPVWSQDLYSVTVMENGPIVMNVLTVSAMSSSPVTYDIVTDPSGALTVAPNLGIVTTRTSLDREALPQFNVTIRSCNLGELCSNVTLMVIVGDVNDNSPQFLPSNQLTYDASEGLGVGSEVFTLSVDDKDLGTNADVVYSFVGKAPSYFTITTATGRVNVEQRMDREQTDQISFQVEAKDMGRPKLASTAEVTVNVLDVNDNSPKFMKTKYEQNVTIPVAVGYTVIQVIAQDPDEGKNGEVRYSIASGLTDEKLSINDSSGVISVLKNYDLKSIYQLTVRASDGGAHSSDVRVVIYFVHRPGSIQFIPDRYIETIRENNLLNEDIVTVKAVDFLQSTSSHLYYSLAIPSDHFKINSNTGVIAVIESLDREATSKYRLVVQVEDTFDRSRVALADVDIIVEDVNDNSPMFTKDTYQATVRDDTAQGTSVTRVEATDADAGKNGEIMYTIVATTTDKFKIDKNGVISTTTTLARTGSQAIRHTMTIIASDKGTPPRNDSAVVNIFIVDVDAPRFNSTSYAVSVMESAPKGSVVAHLVADSMAARKPKYTIVSGDNQQQFSMDPDSGVMTISNLLDFESITQYILRVRASDTLTRALYAEALLNVTVIDVNDNDPIFSHPGFMASVDEDVAIGTVLIVLTAADKDSGSFGKVRYSIKTVDRTQNFGDVFDIHPLSGNLTNVKSLDYEKHKVYHFTVTAQDGGQPPRLSDTEVRIRPLNVNDNKPKFSQSELKASVEEDAVAGTTITTIQATDEDGDVLLYSLVDVPGDGQVDSKIGDFKLDPNSGVLTTNVQKLTRLQYRFRVAASDGMYQVLANLTIDVLDVNDNFPIFNSSQYRGQVLENQASGVFVTQVFATDADLGTNGQLKYEFATRSMNFFLDQVTGRLTTASSDLDREDVPSYYLQVKATDGGGFVALTDVVVDIIDVNDQTPQFDLCSGQHCRFVFSVSEATAIGDVVITLSAIDRDIGTNAIITYGIVNTTVPHPFQIGNATGDMILTQSLDFEASVKFYDVPVLAVDHGSPSLTGKIDLRISITDVQDSAPQFTLTSYASNVSEDASVGYPVATVCAGDDTSHGIKCPSENRTVRYAIVSALESGVYTKVRYFKVNSSGVVTVDRILPDFSATRRHDVVVEARYSDSLHLTSYGRVEITVLDVNNNDPIWTVQYDYSAGVKENIAAGQPVVIVSADDADYGKNAELQYFLRDPGTDPFDIDPVTGAINSTMPLDRETTDHYSFEVYAQDRGDQPRKSDYKRVTVTVDDVNDNPPIFQQQEYVVNISEAAHTSEFVIAVSATDKDIVSKKKLQYTIIAGNVQGAFAIKRSTGEITVAEGLDREINPSYTLSVNVFDEQHNSLTTVRVTVLDVNDNPPDLQPVSDVHIREDSQIGYVMVTVSATDVDLGTNAAIEYSLSSQTPYSVFSIDAQSGNVTVASELDYENTTSYHLTVEATNPSNLNMKDVIGIRIFIEDVNDNVPRFASHVLTQYVEEDSVPGSVVGQLTATDRDSGTNGKIRYSLRHNANQTFVIDAKTGIITTGASLDREQQESYNISVEAIDEGQPPMSSSAPVVVFVTDVNDNSPEFTSLLFDVDLSEDTAVDTVITTVTASDKDEGSNAQVTYGLLNPGDFPNFRVESKTGNITLAQQVDFEAKQAYNLTIQATDRGFPVGSSTVNILINVIDVNDNQPVFHNLPYSTTVREDVPVGNVVFRPTVSDRDSSSNAALFFTIIAGNAVGAFSVNTSTGAITTSQKLDRETRDLYELRLQVSDKGVPLMSAMADVQITVEDVNDNSPVFSPAVFKGSVPENVDCTSNIIVTVTTTDADLCSTAPCVTFGLDSADINHAFILEGDQILCNSTFDRELQKEYLLTVTATDTGDPPLTSSTTVRIEILDESDNDPVAHKRDFLVNYVDQFVGTIGRVGIYDPDDRDQMTYEILVGDKATLDLNATTGVLSVQQMPVKSKYPLEVIAYQVQSYQTVVNVFFQLVNDEMKKQSVTLQLEGVSPNLFIAHHYKTFKRVIADTLTVDQTDVSVLSVQALPLLDSAAIVDVVFVARDKEKGLFFKREYVQSEVFRNKSSIESQLVLRVLAVTIDHCVPEPCNNHGICKNVFSLGESYDVVESEALWMQSLHKVTDYDCSCVPSFYGKDCGQGKMDFCHSSPCQHEGVCINNIDSFTCDCLHNITGTSCEFKKDYCESQPCLNGGTCVDQPTMFSCVCPTDYTGRQCEQPVFAINRCSQDQPVCQNQGSCTSGPYGVTCTCDSNFKGTQCEISDEGNENVTCMQNPCKFGGTCMQKSYDYDCICPMGFEGAMCQNDIDECLNSQCQNGGKCIDGQGGYRCLCGADYTGRMCETEVSPCEVARCPDNLLCVRDTRSSSGFNCVNLCETFICLHGGTCHQKGSQTTCSCLDKNSGEHCELTRASFTPGSFLMFPSVALPRSGRLSLQFVTKANDALLLFNGRYDDQIENDFIAVEVVGGVAVTRYTVGGSVAQLEIPRVHVNDGVWHSLDIEWHENLINMTLDGCRQPRVSHFSSGDTLNTSNCFAKTQTSGNFSSLDLTAPLFIGGSEDYGQNLVYPTMSLDYSGCIEEVVITGSIVLDVRSPLKNQGVQEGCPVMERGCASNPCGGNAACIEAWDSYQCICNLGYTGDRCSEERKPMKFDGNGYVSYEVLERFRQRASRDTRVAAKYSDRFEIRLRTQAASRRMIIWKIETENQLNRLEVDMGRPRFIFNLNGKAIGSTQLELPANVADGWWHELVVERLGNTASLTLDGTTTTKQSAVPSHYLFLLPSNGVYHVGGSPALNSSNAENGFEGCLQDPRLDGAEMPGIGEMSSDFSVEASSPSVVSGCPSTQVCVPSPCLQTETCVDEWETYRCVPINCSFSPCKNGATCVSAGKCICATGYAGAACQTDINECNYNPCLPGEECRNTLGGYDCVRVVFAHLETANQRLEIVAFVVAFVVIFIVVIMIVIVRVWCSSRRGKGQIARDESGDLGANHYGLVEGPAMRYLRDFETRQELAGPDTEGAGEEDCNESIQSEKRWSGSTQNSSFKPKPKPRPNAAVPRSIQSRYVTVPLVFANYQATQDETEMTSTKGSTVVKPSHLMTSVRRPTPVHEDDDEALEHTSFPVRAIPSSAANDNVKGVSVEDYGEVEGFMTAKLAELLAKENDSNDRLCCFTEEGVMSQSGSLSTLSGIGDSDSETEEAFWERVRNFGPEFEKITDMLVANSVSADTSC